MKKKKIKDAEESENAYLDALEKNKELAEKNPDTYLAKVADTQNNLGALYDDLGKFEEAEHAYQKALVIFKELADKNPDAYKINVAMMNNNIGI